MNSGRTSKEPQFLDGEGQTHEISGENRNSIRNYTEDACYVLQIICLVSVYMRIWVKLNLKSNGLVNLEEEILRLLSIQAVAQLLLTCFSQVLQWELESEIKTERSNDSKNYAVCQIGSLFLKLMTKRPWLSKRLVLSICNGEIEKVPQGLLSTGKIPSIADSVM